MTTVFITGCAGFIGSQLVDRLLARGDRVVGFDDFSSGQRRFLAGALQQPGFRLIEGDLLDRSTLTAAMRGADCVFHLAANADVRFGPAQPRRDLEQNTLATHNVLESMRLTGVRRIAFASTGSVYGEARIFPTPEDAPFPVQTSLYGASKVAGEGLIAAYCEAFEFRAWIFRFVSILGERYSHGTTWEWSITVPMAMPVWANGTAESRDACMKDFTAAWGRFLKETRPERLARAWELERAFEARHQRMGMSQTDAT